LRDVLAGKQPEAVQLEPLRAGKCSGLPVPGHLMLQERVAKHYPDFRPSTDGKIIFIECVGRPLHVWVKALESLYKLGYFENCAGVVFCEFVSCGSAKEVKRELCEFSAKLKCPVWMGFPFGHKHRNYTIDMRRQVVIDDAGQLTFE
ncbi:MAG: hypothetical protein PHI35_06360, partial [Victivallaceae bacterium]|nr:hypothetical protein [Victivallaceae bacterium]